MNGMKKSIHLYWNPVKNFLEMAESYKRSKCLSVTSRSRSLLLRV